jgi:TonB family protein
VQGLLSVLLALTFQTPAPDSWHVRTSGDQAEQPIITLDLSALKPVSGPGFQMDPILFVRCRDQQLMIYVATGWLLQSDDSVTGLTPVRIGWDTAAAQGARWIRSTDNTAAFAPDPFAFLAALQAHGALRFEIHPVDVAAITVAFNTQGLSTHVWAITSACPAAGRRTAGADTAPMHPDSAGAVFIERAVDQRPAIVSGPRLVYPEMLRRAGISGRVLVQTIIDTTGRAEPGSIRVTRTDHPGLNASAIDYVSGAHFRPARLHGRAVRVLIYLPIDFVIR